MVLPVNESYSSGPVMSLSSTLENCCHRPACPRSFIGGIASKASDSGSDSNFSAAEEPSLPPLPPLQTKHPLDPSPPAVPRRGSKLAVLLWKNWRLQLRHPFQTIAEILTPVIFIAVIAILWLLLKPKMTKTATSRSAFVPSTTIGFYPMGSRIISEATSKGLVIAWAPGDHSTEEYVESIRNVMKLAFQEQLDTKEFNSQQEMEAYLTQHARMNLNPANNGSTAVWMGIVLEDAENPLSPQLCSKNLKMTLRFPGELPLDFQIKPSPERNWVTNRLFPAMPMAPQEDKEAPFGPSPYYVPVGVLSIQTAVSNAITSICYQEVNPEQGKAVQDSQTSQSLSPDKVSTLYLLTPSMRLQRSSIPTENKIFQTMLDIIPCFMVMSFGCTFQFTVKAITIEKEKQLKELMKIMGLPGYLHWAAWFIKTITFLSISVVLIVVIVKVPWDPNSGEAMFTNSSGILIFVFMFLYIIATTCFSFMISVFFSSANSAATIAGVLWILSIVPYYLTKEKYMEYALSVKLLCSLILNSAVSYGFRIIIMFEGLDEGLNWDNVGSPAQHEDNFTMGHVMLMLIVDSLIYLVITLYVEAVFPGSYGVPKPWYFPVQKSFWCGSKQRQAYRLITPPEEHHSNYEMEPQNTKAGIQVRNLRKVFHGQSAAVDNLTLNMYEGQITVLLGPNGAGKSTTMSMLTGMYPPTSGSALVNRYDVVTDMDSARDSLGLCPQQDVLFDELTVRDHLYFFGKLKGLSGKELEEQIRKYLTLLQLRPKERTQTRKLSGGLKRKLATGIALCGKSKVVLLDEPTSGMDPSARHALWDLLREEKAGRTLLLTTHALDEADLLGDRVAIMAGGRLQCCGSPFFLKQRFGAGYRLVVVKGPRCSAPAVTQLLARHVPGLAPAQDVGAELSYQLDKKRAPRFEPMLRELEKRQAALDVQSYGVSPTTLEDVFIKVCKDQEVNLEDDSLKQLKAEKRNTHAYSVETILPVRRGESEDGGGRPVLLTGCALVKQQLRAMVMKRRLVLARSWILFAVHCLITPAFIIFTLLSIRYFPQAQDPKTRTIDLQDYSYPNITMDVLNDKSSGMAELILKKIATEYKIVVAESGYPPKEIIASSDSTRLFEEYILDLYRASRARRTFDEGASFDVENSAPYITGWFNDFPYHSVPLTLKLIINAFLKTIEIRSIELPVTDVNSPLPFTSKSQVTNTSSLDNIGFQIMFSFGFCMALVAAYYILFPVEEFGSKSKHLQLVSGVKVLVFWIVNLTFDWLSFLIPSVLAIITLAIFQEDGFSSFEELGRILLILIFLGWAILPFAYCVTERSTIPVNAYTYLIIFYMITGVLLFTMITLSSSNSYQRKNNGLYDFLLFLPTFCMSDAIFSANINGESIKMCKTFNCADLKTHSCCPNKCPTTGCLVYSENYFQMKYPGIGRNIIAFIVMGCLFNIILILYEYRALFRNLQSNVAAAPKSRPVASATQVSLKEPSPNPEDSDVKMEKERIRTSSVTELTREFSLVLRNATKYYGDFLAVDNICLGVRKGECFGLLGVNGAGKTTIFKMMTGEEKLSGGDAFLCGLNIRKNIQKVHQFIGYCPQFDGLLKEMTGRETLHMFCLLRGIPRNQISEIVNDLVSELLFTQVIDKKVKEYSGGNKRKVSTAVALVGNPRLVFLDEPTTGMDPLAKRRVWNLICKVRDRGSSIILTSHSMEECEALCTRIAIMVNGKFRCLGSIQHLKTKYSTGYTLIIEVDASRPISGTSSNTSLYPVIDFVQSSFPSAILRDEYMGRLTYYIPRSKLTFSQVFGLMEKNKKELRIREYTVGQTSLEQVFLTFARDQNYEMI